MFFNRLIKQRTKITIFSKKICCVNVSKNFNKSNLLIFLKEINSEKKQFNFKYSRHFVTNRHLIIKVKNKGKFFLLDY